MTCGTCHWFDRTLGGNLLPEHFNDEEDIGGCDWPAENLPYSLRYGNRERMGVSARDGAECPCHQKINTSSDPDPD